MNTPRQSSSQDGFAMLALIVVMVPLLFLVGSYLQTMSGRNQRLQLEVREEQAMMDAESGVDVAIYESRLGNLVAGHNFTRTYTAALPSGSKYTAVCTYLGDDDLDNDNDAAVDEPDEDVFEVVSTGTAGTNVRRINAYLGFSPFLPAPDGAISMMNQAPTDIRITGAPVLDGRNYTVGGALVGAGNSYGMTIAAPAATTQLTNLLTPGEQSHVVGVTPTPSVAQQSTMNAAGFAETVAQANAAAQVVLTNGIVAGNVTIGNPTTGPQYIVTRNGDLRINGNFTGAGLLVINGNLRILGTMTWYGVILVTGNLDAGSGTARVYGGIVTGGPVVMLSGTCDLRYSAQAINLAQRLTGRYVAFNGWQEVTTNN